MLLKTKYHGEIEVAENDVLHFGHGIPGFLDEKEFVLLSLEEGSPFSILQSKKTSELGFVVVNPFLFFKDYEFDLGEADKELLSLEKEEDVVVWTILTLKETFEESTANLQAPIIVNSKTKKAKQIIINNPSLRTKHKILTNI
ncbi:flagellar assembly protein FliW [Metabacillus herbersteinensis]|uniref:Flagellar assembly factor FliW n=1 Tax=Metabacillus herbersteinensis TaxID=283816 RepID=A0ABV6GEV1_9BACI